MDETLPSEEVPHASQKVYPDRSTPIQSAAKDKKKAPLPEDVLKAHTVWVIVDPTAGVDNRRMVGQ
jgi:hypothetical protein